MQILIIISCTKDEFTIGENELILEIESLVPTSYSVTVNYKLSNNCQKVGILWDTKEINIESANIDILELGKNSIDFSGLISGSEYYFKLCEYSDSTNIVYSEEKSVYLKNLDIVFNKEIQIADGPLFPSAVLLLRNNQFILAADVDKGLNVDKETWIGKVDLDGNVIWSFVFNIMDDGREPIFELMELDNGDLIGIGFSVHYTDRGIPQWYMVAIRFTTDGNLIYKQHFFQYWYHHYDFTKLSENGLLHIYTTSDSTYHQSSDEQFLTEFIVNSEGEVNYVKNINFHKDLVNLQPKGENAYLSSGNKSKGDHMISSDIRIRKLDENFNLLWEKDFGGPVDDRIGTYKFVSTSNENSVFFGQHGRNTAIDGEDYWVFEIDDSGNINWEYKVGKKNFTYGPGYGNYNSDDQSILTIYQETYSPSVPLYTVNRVSKIKEGRLIWNFLFGEENTNANNPWYFNVFQVNDHIYLFGYSSNVHLNIVKFKP